MFHKFFRYSLFFVALITSVVADEELSIDPQLQAIINESIAQQAMNQPVSGSVRKKEKLNWEGFYLGINSGAIINVAKGYLNRY